MPPARQVSEPESQGDPNAPAAFCLPGSWWLFYDDRGSAKPRLEALLPTTGASLHVEGEFARALARGRTEAAGSSVLRRLSPELDALATAIERIGPPVPLTRDNVLRGDGFDRLFVELTAQCNERCVHCYASAAPERSEALSWAELESVIREGHRVGFQTIQLTGGDPLIHPDIVRATHLAREVGYRSVEIYTNGLALTESLYRRLRPAKPAFAFSVYSHRPETHDAIMQTAKSWLRTKEAIERTLKGGSTVRVGIVLTAVNPDDGPSTRRWLQSLGLDADHITADASREVGRGQAELALLNRRGEDQSAHGSRREFGGRLAVSYDGRVLPCIFNRAQPLGSIRHRPLGAIVNDPQPMRANAEALLERSRQWSRHLSCWQCQLRAEMLGSAPIAWHAEEAPR